MTIVKLKLSLLLMVVLGTQAASAQWEQTDKIPPYRDFIVDIQPDGFVHTFEQGAFARRIIEYVPEGETLKKWTQLLSILAVGPSKTLPDEKAYAQALFDSMQAQVTCDRFEKTVLEQSKNEIVYLVVCDGIKGGNLMGAAKGVDWEVGVYRFLRTPEALYQIHFAEHNKKSLSKKRLRGIQDAALKAVSDVAVCQLDVADPCPELDYYVLGTEPKEVVGAPPCRTDPTVPCVPAANFTVEPPSSAKIDSSRKKTLITLDMSKEDLSSMATINKVGGALLMALKSGAPAVNLLIRGPDPNYQVTSQDRVKVATFFSIIRGVLIDQKAINPNTIQNVWVNFR